MPLPAMATKRSATAANGTRSTLPLSRPDALLTPVHDVAAAAFGEEALGRLEQHLARFAVHEESPSLAPPLRPAKGRCRRLRRRRGHATPRILLRLDPSGRCASASP